MSAPLESNGATIDVELAGPEHAAGLTSLFERAGSPCYCRYYHFEGDKNQWLERCALATHENRAELEHALAERSDEAKGLVAIDSGTVVGWLKVAPAGGMQKLYGNRLYKGLPCFGGDREGVFAIGCVLVDPTRRRSGVATALVLGAVRLAPAWGARALEAFPRRPREPVADEELWTGPHSAFALAGFATVNEFEPYPVLRRTL
jgi:GNAT superfamily N-acetyltransferase